MTKNQRDKEVKENREETHPPAIVIEDLYNILQEILLEKPKREAVPSNLNTFVLFYNTGRSTVLDSISEHDFTCHPCSANDPIGIAITHMPAYLHKCATFLRGHAHAVAVQGVSPAIFQLYLKKAMTADEEKFRIKITHDKDDQTTINIFVKGAKIGPIPLYPLFKIDLNKYNQI